MTTSGVRRRGWKLGWGVTGRCNMRCAFCYSAGLRRLTELSVQKCKSFIDRNSSFIEAINYGTGENTLSDVWPELVAYIAATYPYIAQALTTNGHLAAAVAGGQLPRSILGSLQEVDVSLDFCDESRHNSFRGHSEAYKGAVNTIELCRSHGLRTTVVVMGIDETLQIENLRGIFRLASTYGCLVRINVFRPNDGQRLPPTGYLPLVESINWIAGEHSIVSLADPLISAVFLREAAEDCTGVSSLRILPNGAITPSTYLVGKEFWQGSLETADLGSDEFSARLMAALGEDNVLPAECSTCVLAPMCQGGAVDRRLIWYGTLRERDPYCPTRHGSRVNSHVLQSCRTPSLDSPCIHDGYLPTMIFAPATVSLGALNGSERRIADES